MRGRGARANVLKSNVECARNRSDGSERQKNVAPMKLQTRDGGGRSSK
jgi:hypothetical protein